MTVERFKSTRRVVLKAGAAAALIAAASVRAQSEGEKTGGGKVAAKATEKVSPVMGTLAAYIARALNNPLPEPVTEATKHHLIDTLAAMISGSHLVPGRKAIAYVESLGGTQEACVPGSKIITNVVNAALAGGMLAHADETDDSHAA